MQKFLTENEVDPEEAARWAPETHKFNSSGSKYYAYGYLGALNLLAKNRKKINVNFGDDSRE